MTYSGHTSEALNVGATCRTARWLPGDSGRVARVGELNFSAADACQEVFPGGRGEGRRGAGRVLAVADGDEAGQLVATSTQSLPVPE